MKSLFLNLIFSLFSFSAQAQSIEFCPEKITALEMKNLITQVQNEFFPKLHRVNIELKEFTSQAYFLQAEPDLLSRTVLKTQRKYFIMINTSLYSCSPSREALKAILVHEFEHIQDFENKTSWALGGHALHYGISRKYHANYERETDLKAIAKGVGLGLIEYRKWLYLRLTEKDLKKKLFYYLNPIEIEKEMMMKDGPLLRQK